MAFKPVGVDQDGKFPTRVLNALKNLFETKGLSEASKTSIADAYVSSKVTTPISRMTMLPTLVRNEWAGYNGGRIVTARGFEYTAYVRDTDSHIVIAQRPVGTKKWVVSDLNSLLGAQFADGHNYTSIGVDSAGYIHVSGNMHAVALKYIKSTAPDSITNFAAATMIGSDEVSATYPEFLSTAGILFFLYRNGGSGDGNVYLNKYDTTTGTWTRVTMLFQGIDATNRSAYNSTIAVGPDGSLNIAWCWRDSNVANTNHDVCFIRSSDLGATWKTIENVTIPTPITFANSPIVFPTDAADSGLLNSPNVSVDGSGNPHIAFLLYDANGYSNVKHVWHDATGWHNEFVTFGDYRMATNVTILDGNVGRPGIVSYKGKTFVLWRASKSGKSSYPRAIDVSTPGQPFEFPLAELDVQYQEPIGFDTNAMAQGILKVFLSPQPLGGAAGGNNFYSQWGGILEIQLDRLNLIGGLQGGAPRIQPGPTQATPGVAMTATSYTDATGVPNMMIPASWADRTVLVKLRDRIRASTGGGAEWWISQYNSSGGGVLQRAKTAISGSGAGLFETPWVPLQMSSLTTGGWIALQAKWVPASGDTTGNTQLTIGGMEIAFIRDANGDFL